MTPEEALKKHKKIAVIGYSDKGIRPSKKIAQYMAEHGYTVYGVNPRLQGECIGEIDCYTSIKDIPDEVEIVDVFRRSDAVHDLVKEVLELPYKPKVIWTQIGVFNEDAKKLAEENGIDYIENKCIYVEHDKMS